MKYPLIAYERRKSFVSKHLAWPYIFKFALLAMIVVMGFWAVRFIVLTPASPLEHLKFIETPTFFVCIFGLTLWTSRGLERMPTWRALLFIALIACVLRALWVIRVPNELVSDFAIYHELALSIASGKGYTLTGPASNEDLRLYLGTDKQFPYTTAYRAPGVSLWAALWIKILGDHSIIFKLLNIILSVGTVVLLFFTLAPTRPKLAVRAAWLWALYPPAIMATNLFGTETLFTFFLVLLSYLMTQPGKDSSYKYMSLGLITAWTALIRSMLWALLGSIGAVIVIRSPWKKAIKRMTVFLAFAALGLSPWVLRNWKTFHHIVPVCTSEGEFLGRHSMYLLIGISPVETNPRYRAWRAISDEFTRSSEGYRMALANWSDILGRGVGFTLNCLQRSTQSIYQVDDEILFWSVTKSYGDMIRPGLPVVMSFEAIQHWRWFSEAFYLFILLGALIGITRLPSAALAQFESIHVLAANFILFFIANLLVISKPRYHFAMMPFLIILAAQGYQT